MTNWLGLQVFLPYMTDAQIYSSFSKAHKLLCATPSVSSKSTASIILLSLIHSHLLNKNNDSPSQQDNRSIETMSTLCGVPFDRIHPEFQEIPIDTLNAIRHTIDTWGLTLELYENVFGSLFEKYITDKKSGAYYTSPATSEYITLRSLLTYLMKGIIHHDTLFRICTLDQPLKWFSETVKDLTEVQQSSIIDRLANVTIIDPTCGTGAFLVQAFKCLLQIYQILSFKVDKNLIRSIIRKNLYGVDIDPEAITILKFRFLVIAQSLGIDDIKSMPNFKIGDTLKSDTFSQSEGFPDGGTFDIVIGNPPYVETTRRQRDTFDTGLTTLECGNLYALVTEKAIRNILKEGGDIRLYSPDISCINRPHGTFARAHLQQQ